MSGYISEVDYDGGAGSNFVEVVIPKGTDVSGYSLVIYDNDGTVIETYSFGAPTQTFVGKDVYLFDDNTANWVDIHNNEAIALVDDTGSVVQFIAFKDPVTAVEGPANGLSATQIGEHSGGDESLVTSDNGSSYSPTPAATAGTIPCFTHGTLIRTPEGDVPAEQLQVGALVVTEDHGCQPIRYLARSTVTGPNIPQNRLPVLIPRGSLGPDQPVRDLVVSGQHRMLLAWREVRQLFGDAEVLAPAKGLLQLQGVRVKRGVRQVDYVHILFDRHEVIYAEGARTESYYPGPTILRDMSETNRRALLRAVPELRYGVEAAIGAPARRFLRVQETGKLVQKYRQRLKHQIRTWDIEPVTEAGDAGRPVSHGTRGPVFKRRVA